MSNRNRVYTGILEILRIQIIWRIFNFNELEYLSYATDATPIHFKKFLRWYGSMREAVTVLELHSFLH